MSTSSRLDTLIRAVRRRLDWGDTSQNDPMLLAFSGSGDDRVAGIPLSAIEAGGSGSVAFADLTGKPTTLAGYGITDALAAASTAEALAGTSTEKAVTPDALAALWEKGSDVASAGTISLGDGGVFHITGTTTITDIDFATPKDGRMAILIFDGALTLTHHATTLKLPGGANITTAAGDRAIVMQDSSDNVVVVDYIRASAVPLMIQFMGCRVRMNADDTTQNPSGGLDITFDVADFDTDAFWSAGAPTRITIPAGKGITHVNLVGQVDVSASAGGAFTVAIRHFNSSDTLLKTIGAFAPDFTGANKAAQAVTGPVAVSAGDYFVLTLTDPDTSLTIEGDLTRETYMTLQVIGRTQV